MKVKEKIDITLAILVAVVLIALIFTWWKGGWQLTRSGLIQAWHLIDTVWLRLLIGITLSGMVQLLIPRDFISRWLGPESGIKGILIGSYSAIVISGPPYVMIPVVASLYI